MRDIDTFSPVLPFNQHSPFNYHPNRNGSGGNHLIIGQIVSGQESPTSIYTEDNQLPDDGEYTKYFKKGDIVHDETVLFRQKGVEYVHPSGDVPCEKRYFGLGVNPKPQS